MNTQIGNNYAALVEALFLAITAPTEEQAQKAVSMAEHFASQPSIAKYGDFLVNRAKAEAKHKHLFPRIEEGETL